MRSRVQCADIEELLMVPGSNSPVGACIIQEGRFCYVSPAFPALTGYGAHELEGRDSLEIVVPDDRDKLRENTIRMLKGESACPCQFRVVGKDGGIRWVMQTASSIRYRGRRAALVNYMDITERKQAEEALRESEAKDRLLSENATDVIWTMDMNLKYTYVSPSVQKLLGYSPEEFTSLSIDETLADPSLAAARRLFEEELAAERLGQESQERTRTMELQLVCRDRSAVWVEAKMAFVRDEEGLATGILGIARDITERKRAEESLRQSEERYRAILEEMEDSYFEVDLGGHFTFVNSAVCRNLGYSKEELIGMSYRGFAVAEEVDCVYRVFNEVYRSGTANKGFAWQIMHRDGSPWFVDTSVSPLRNSTGEIVGFRGVARDVTERRQAEQALRDSEERYRSLVNNVDQGIFRSTPGPRGRFLEVNPALEHITGYSRDELLNIDVAHLYCNAEERDEAVRELESSPQPLERETLCQRKDGNEIIVSEVTVPVRDAAGRVLYFDGILEDITERNQAEKALKLQRAQFQQLFDNSPDAIVMLDTKERVLQANSGFERLFGYGAEEIRDRPIKELIIPEDRAKEASALSRAVFHGRFVREEEVRRRKDGSLVDVSIVGYPLRLEGKLVGIYVIYSDISARRKMERDIRRAAEEWRETFDSISDAVSIHGSDFRLRRVNKAFAARFGTTPRQIIGKHCYEVVHGTKEPVPGCPHQETLRTERPAGAEFLTSDNGVCLELTTSPIFDERGEVAGTVHIARDVTERKQQSLQLMMTDRLASIGELAAGTAHELNNPLTSVIGFSQLLMEREVPNDIREDLELIHSEARRAAEVTKNLLTFARKHAPVKQANRIEIIVEDVLRLRAYEQRLSNIRVKKQFAAGLPEVVVDYFQIQQVLLNLIINAEYFMTEAHKGGILTIAARRRNSTMIISVADDGPGIPKEDLSQVFNPFFTTKKAGRGTGLGLSICHGIVTEHGGRIYAKSELGRGATFFVELPINHSDHNGGTS